MQQRVSKAVIFSFTYTLYAHEGTKHGCVFYISDSRFMLVGHKTRNCRDNGWDGRIPVCEGKDFSAHFVRVCSRTFCSTQMNVLFFFLVTKCSPPPLVQNSEYEPMKEEYTKDEAVQYSCSSSYTLVGAMTLTCTDNGTFSPSPPKCLSEFWRITCMDVIG